MAVKIERSCSRCRRNDPYVAESVQAAMDYEELQKARALKATEIEAFFAGIPEELRPAYVGYAGGTLVIHDHLCAGEDVKRSCEKRVGDLLEQAGQHEERKPRTKKAKPEAEAAAE